MKDSNDIGEQVVLC